MGHPWQDPLKIRLIYRKQSWNIPSFVDALSQLLYDEIDIILDDFNVDGLAEINPLTNVLQNFNLILKSPTHLAGSLLDHFYVRK